MWPSQNFLLCNGTVMKTKVNEWINNKKKICYASPPPMGIHTTCTNYNNLISKKSKRYFIPVKYNRTCTKEVNLMPSKQFSDISKFQNFFGKNEKKKSIDFISSITEIWCNH